MNVTEKKSFISISTLTCLYAHNAVISTVSVYTSLLHAKASDFENDEVRERDR